MQRSRRSFVVAALVIAAGGMVMAQKAPPRPAKKTVAATPAATVSGKPLSANAQKALRWLANAQNPNGGWSEGEEAPGMRQSRAETAVTRDGVADPCNVADTSMAALALLRSGSTPKSGPYAAHIRRAVDYVTAEIGRSDAASLYVTDARNTRLQMKLGPYIDTFLSSLLLAEVKGHMPEAKSEKRVVAALDKVLGKMERNQKQDGTWDDKGWAPALSQSVAAKAVNRAAQKGAKVNEKVRSRTETYARGNFDARSGGFGGGGSAGVDLYASASGVGALQDSDNTNQAREKTARFQLSRAKTEPERRAARQTLDGIAANRKDLAAAQSAIVRKMEDKQFVAGFGSNGGEEFLSYMQLGESLRARGGTEWRKWDQSMTANMNRIQNEDGSWSGDHCITGRTFCTASALMVLTVDRAPLPVAAKIGRR